MHAHRRKKDGKRVREVERDNPVNPPERCFSLIPAVSLERYPRNAEGGGPEGRVQTLTFHYPSISSHSSILSCLYPPSILPTHHKNMEGWKGGDGFYISPGSPPIPLYFPTPISPHLSNPSSLSLLLYPSLYPTSSPPLHPSLYIFILQLWVGMYIKEAWCRCCDSSPCPSTSVHWVLKALSWLQPHHLCSHSNLQTIIQETS